MPRLDRPIENRNPSPAGAAPFLKERLQDCTNEHSAKRYRALIDKLSFIAICGVDDEDDLVGYVVKKDGIYTKERDKHTLSLLTGVERSVLEWHPTGNHADQALELPCTVASLCRFVEWGGLSDCIDEKALKEIVAKQEIFAAPIASEVAKDMQEQELDASTAVSGEAPAQTDTAPSGSTKKAALQAKQAKLLKIVEELERYAESTGLPFDPMSMPGPLGHDWNEEGSFHWLCAKIDRDFKKAKATFETYRSDICPVAKYAQKSNFYRLALPHIAPIFDAAKKSKSTS